MTNFGFRPLAGCGLFPQWQSIRASLKVSVPLRGVGCFDAAPHALHILCKVSVPLRGVGCFAEYRRLTLKHQFTSPCGVWVVSHPEVLRRGRLHGFRPLAGCGLFLHPAA